MKTKRAMLITAGLPSMCNALPELEGKELELKKLYPFIGNDCDIVQCVDIRKKGVEMWADEEGLLKASPTVNMLATKLFQEAYGPEVGVVGNVILTDNTKDGKLFKSLIPNYHD